MKLNGKIQHCVTVSLFGFEPILGKMHPSFFSTLQIVSPKRVNMAAPGFFVTPNRSKESAAWIFCGISRGSPEREEIDGTGGLCPSFGSHSPLTEANFEETGKARATWCRDGYPLWEAFPLLPHLTLPLFISLCRPSARFALRVAVARR